MILSALVTGRSEAAKHTDEQWVAEVLKAVPYHPAGRFPEKKVSDLGMAMLPAAIDGERALVERLAKIPNRAARWVHLYDEDEPGLEARMDPPAHLGAAYDPAVVGQSWDTLIAWGAGTDGFEAGLSKLPWVLVGGEDEGPDVLGELQALLPATRRGTDVIGLLEDVADDVAARFVLVGQGSGIRAVLQALVDNPGLRDRTLAVVSIAGELSGPEVDDWMGANFSHAELDTEISRPSFYMALQWLDRKAEIVGAFGRELRHARFPPPKVEVLVEENVQTVDLGVLPHDSDPKLVAQGLWAFVSLWIARHAG